MNPPKQHCCPAGSRRWDCSACLLTNAKVMNGEPLSAAEAWDIRDRFRSDSRVGYLAEPVGFEDEWRETSKSGKVGPNFRTDAYLVSLCRAADCTLVTFDRALAAQNKCEVRLLVTSANVADTLPPANSEPSH